MANKTIGNPLSWTASHVSATGSHLGEMAQSVGSDIERAPPEVKTLCMDDLRDALRLGYEDFKSFRSDVITICVLYPIIGICLAFLAFQGNLFHLIFPVISGFALVGPVAAVGMYEMSRRREADEPTSWFAVFDVIRSPSFGAILALGLWLFAIFVAWLFAANAIYAQTIGLRPPPSLGAFLFDTLSTGAGWWMIIAGTAVGFCFAVAVLMISFVSFPLLLDRKVGLPMAVVTSSKVVMRNPGPAAAWGLIVAASLLIGSIPALLGLIVALPVLGHATWHLYRKAVA
ncbi:DUF2189 domain-containing protein [Qingshengfaniella alkalisoli]|uniref:DUF2189 domain-containing protein n=1 Tax=Qingshengfaniella alkalisoli TaxID=2599296 RepID=A0A5B8IB29_9RHOB|nr:DUF2189 domain-containing protein [Qingshengfaniella alkalisoli]QDY71329.1 DUF2189 domain-containing protein [Qingshengfaniella alkalisoli]